MSETKINECCEYCEYSNLDAGYGLHCSLLMFDDQDYRLDRVGYSFVCDKFKSVTSKDKVYRKDINYRRASC